MKETEFNHSNKPYSIKNILNKKNEANKIYLELQAKKNLKVLELGFGDPINLLLCIHNFGAADICGVELKKNQQECVFKFIESLKKMEMKVKNHLLKI